MFACAADLRCSSSRMIATAAVLELDYINLLDALGLLYVLAGAEDRRFSPAAGRWRMIASRPSNTAPSGHPLGEYKTASGL